MMEKPPPDDFALEVAPYANSTIFEGHLNDWPERIGFSMKPLIQLASILGSRSKSCRPRLEP